MLLFALVTGKLEPFLKRRISIIADDGWYDAIHGSRSSRCVSYTWEHDYERNASRIKVNRTELAEENLHPVILKQGLGLRDAVKNS